MPTSTTRKRTTRLTGSERRHQIAKAMLTLAEPHSFQGVTTAKNAAHVGVSEPALYMHYESRDMMLRAAIDLRPCEDFRYLEC